MDACELVRLHALMLEQETGHRARPDMLHPLGADAGGSRALLPGLVAKDEAPGALAARLSYCFSRSSARSSCQTVRQAWSRRSVVTGWGAGVGRSTSYSRAS